MDNFHIENSWKKALGHEFEKDYMCNLKKFIAKELDSGKIIYPDGKDIFSAFSHTPFNKVKVVIIGQDPYHGPGQAHGLCFSVKQEIVPPPSLKNIFKEIYEELNIEIPDHGYLGSWADQGVLLLNTILTVEKNSAASHRDIGWETFTDRVVELVNIKRQGAIFVLWGSFAQKKGKGIDRERHFVLEAPHPSPLSSYRGFFGCGHFKKINEILKEQGEKEIDWSLPKKKSLTPK